MFKKILVFILLLSVADCSKVFCSNIKLVNEVVNNNLEETTTKNGVSIFCNYDAAVQDAHTNGKTLILVLFSKKPVLALENLKIGHPGDASFINKPEYSLGYDPLDKIVNIVLLQPRLAVPLIYPPLPDPMTGHMDDFLEKFKVMSDRCIENNKSAYIVSIAVQSYSNSECVMRVDAVPHASLEKVLLWRIVKEVVWGFSEEGNVLPLICPEEDCLDLDNN